MWNLEVVVTTTTLTLLLASATAATDIAVPDDYATIQAAINIAAANDTILVAPGTYTECIDLNGLALILKGIGGPGVTIIDGGGCPHVVSCVSGEGNDTIIDGFTITGGFGGAAYGGGVYIVNSSPTLRNIVIDGNTATNGGGIYCGNSNPILEDCVIANNTTSNDGAGAYWFQSSGSLTRVRFEGNRCDVNTGDGGGMMINADSHPIVSDCMFFDNKVVSGPTRAGGAIMIANNSNPEIRGSIFVENSAVGGPTANWGGAIHVANDASPLVSCCTFMRNSAGRGGAISLSSNLNSGIVTVEGCSFGRNGASLDGGAIYIAGGTLAQTRSAHCENVPNDVVNGPPDDGTIVTCAGCPADANVDGTVNVSDLLFLLASWGSCLP